MLSPPCGLPEDSRRKRRLWVPGSKGHPGYLGLAKRTPWRTLGYTEVCPRSTHSVMHGHRHFYLTWIYRWRKWLSIHRTVLDPKPGDAWSVLSQHTISPQNEPESTHYSPSPNSASVNLSAEPLPHCGHWDLEAYPATQSNAATPARDQPGENTVTHMPEREGRGLLAFYLL